MYILYMILYMILYNYILNIVVCIYLLSHMSFIYGTPPLATTPTYNCRLYTSGRAVQTHIYTRTLIHTHACTHLRSYPLLHWTCSPSYSY